MKSNELLAIRDYRPGDKNFILATWLRGLKYGNDWYNLIPSDIYFKTYQLVLLQLLSSLNVSIKISCLKDDADVILGYSVLNKAHTILHWVFVKSNWRSIGIMKALVPNTVVAATHITKIGLSLLKKNTQVVFNPFLLNEQENNRGES